MNAWETLFERFDQKMYKSQSLVAGEEKAPGNKKCIQPLSTINDAF